MHSDGRVVVSDIDDTVKPHTDRTHDGPVYPGARALFSALDVGRDGTDSRGDIHFVTARDGVVVRAGQTLNNTGVDVGSISYGTTFAMLLAGVGLHRGIAREKVKDILNLAERNPDRKLVLLGDTVQADAKVFAEVLQKIPDRVELVLLHAVPGFSPPVDISGHANVVVFSDYADAARQLHGRGTISDAQRDAILADVAAANSATTVG
jgi:phosphatidate phosphatase APP1